MKFKFAFDGEDGVEVVTIDTEIDYGPVSDAALELIDRVSPVRGEVLENGLDDAKKHYASKFHTANKDSIL